MVAVLVLAAVAIAACGGDSTSESSAAPSTAPSASASTGDSGGYTGPDSEYLTKLDPPTLQSGFTFKVGYLTPFAGIVTLETIKTACKAETERQGGTFISYDAGLDVQKQVSQMQQLISQKVDLIYAYPVTEASLTKPIQQAADAGIPVVLLNTPPDSSRINEVIGAASINVGLAFDEADYQTIKYIADNYPGAKVGIIGYAPPAESLVWIIERELYWCEQLGLDMVAKVDAVDPTPNAATVATQSILAKAPDVQFILGYNDISTLGRGGRGEGGGQDGRAVRHAQRRPGHHRHGHQGWDRAVHVQPGVGRERHPGRVRRLRHPHQAEPAAADPDRADRHAGHEGQRRPARVPALSPVHSCVARLRAVPRDAPRASCRR